MKMTSKLEKCKICGEKVKECKLLNTTVDIYEVDCPICGYYEISDSFLSSALTITQEDLFLFSGHLHLNSSREKPLRIVGEYFKKIPDIVLQYKNLTVIDKLNDILKYIGDESKNLTDRIYIEFLYFPRFFLANYDDLDSLIRYLENKNYIGVERTIDYYYCWLTIDGWTKYETIKQINVYSKKVFVAFKFDTELSDELFKTIEKVCFENFELVAIKSDPLKYNGKICDKIISDIKESRFIVSDFSFQNQGVYYEAGYAMGLGIPVVRTCRKQEVGQLHFDTRQYSHIIWKDFKDLEEQLIPKIKTLL
ncbi:MAG: hypothetical protein PHQ52_03130 [Candidatus Omnitrophica bacterium]|nr:hypothetical protein [Candidatus Omnitrophota bacterium]